MDKKLFKSIIWLLTVAIVIIVCIIRFDMIRSALSFVFSLLAPLFVGLITAFILNPVYNFFCGLYSGEKVPKLFVVLGKFFSGIGRFFKYKVFGAKKESREKKRGKSSAVGKFKKRKRLPKNFFPTVFSLVTTYLFFILVIVLLLIAVIPQLAESFSLFTGNIETYLSNLRGFLDSVAENFHMEDTFFPALENIVKGTLENLSGIVVGAVPQILDVTMSIALWTINIGIGFVLSIYILAGKKTFLEMTKKFISVFFNEKVQDKIFEVSELTYKTFSGFISGRLLDASVVGILCFIGMTIFGFDYPLLISVIICVTNIIPFFGPFIGGIPSAFILLMIDPWEALWFVIFLVVLQQLDGNIIGVRIVGDSVGLPPMWSLVAIILGGGLFGFVGMILGTPAFAVVYTLINRSAAKRLKRKHIMK